MRSSGSGRVGGAQERAPPRLARGERLPVSPEARAIMEESLREAVRRRDGHLGVEHLLLALLRDAKATPVRALAALKTNAPGVERALDQALGRGE